MGVDGNREDTAPGVAAATLILFSESGDGPARHLMIQRAASMSFAPNALVFPGGQVDEDDYRIAADPQRVDAALGDIVERAHRIAAIRETLEETGLAIGFTQPATIDAIAMQAP